MNRNNLQLDTIDWAILGVLQADAALAVHEVGERVGLSSNACWRRIKRLEEAGVIARALVAVAVLVGLSIACLAVGWLLAAVVVTLGAVALGVTGTSALALAARAGAVVEPVSLLHSSARRRDNRIHYQRRWGLDTPSRLQECRVFEQRSSG